VPLARFAMLSAALLLAGMLLLALTLGERAVRKLPLSPALIYLATGFAAAALFPPLDATTLIEGVETWPLRWNTRGRLGCICCISSARHSRCPNRRRSCESGRVPRA
jgi:hypothetical protein